MKINLLNLPENLLIKVANLACGEEILGMVKTCEEVAIVGLGEFFDHRTVEIHENGQILVFNLTRDLLPTLNYPECVRLLTNSNENYSFCDSIEFSKIKTYSGEILTECERIKIVYYDDVHDPNYDWAKKNLLNDFVFKKLSEGFVFLKGCVINKNVIGVQHQKINFSKIILNKND